MKKALGAPQVPQKHSTQPAAGMGTLDQPRHVCQHRPKKLKQAEQQVTNSKASWTKALAAEQSARERLAAEEELCSTWR